MEKKIILVEIKKEFEFPVLDVMDIENEDIIQTSGDPYFLADDESF